MKFVRHNGQLGIIVKSGNELTADIFDSDLDDHLGLWFGEADEAGRPIVYTIPAEYVAQIEVIVTRYQH